MKVTTINGDVASSNLATANLSMWGCSSSGERVHGMHNVRSSILRFSTTFYCGNGARVAHEAHNLGIGRSTRLPASI